MTRSIVLVPTVLERRELLELERIGEVEICGFGPIDAAARTAALLADRRPERALLVGIAGTYDPRAAPVGSAFEVERVAIDGFDGTAFGVGSAIDLRAGCDGTARVLVTVLAPSSSPAEAAVRRSRHAGALAEDMEGYGVALACDRAGIPLAIVRGISNEAGDRDTQRWRIRDALASARRLALEGFA